MAGLILIVDDSPQAAANLEIALAALGEVRVLKSGEEALHVMKRERAAALVTDLDMPAMSGLELIGQLRADSRFARLPIVVASGNTDPSSRETALDAGANAYFAKPYSPAALRSELVRLMEASR